MGIICNLSTGGWKRIGSMCCKKKMKKCDPKAEKTEQ
jgi:hypothetical protein